MTTTTTPSGSDEPERAGEEAPDVGAQPSESSAAPDLSRRLPPPMRPLPMDIVNPLPREYATTEQGIGGRIKVRAEDFLVDELPLFDPQGFGEHL